MVQMRRIGAMNVAMIDEWRVQESIEMTMVMHVTAVTHGMVVVVVVVVAWMQWALLVR
jgi:hypothetical protein